MQPKQRNKQRISDIFIPVEGLLNALQKVIEVSSNSNKFTTRQTLRFQTKMEYESSIAQVLPN